MSKLCDYLADVLNFMHLRQRSNHRKFCRFRAIMWVEMGPGRSNMVENVDFRSKN